MGPSKVKTSILVLAAILFVGVVVMAYGYFHDNSPIMYFGLFTTGTASLAILVQILIKQNGNRGI
jgi:uncharacterized membrane protein YecN with MAPEG domain